MSHTPSRTVIVGDVHGCLRELGDLLELVRFRAGADRLFLVGDLVARGPDSAGVVALVAQLAGRSVRGNHEEKLLAWRRGEARLSSAHRGVADELSDGQWLMLEAMPLWLDLPEHGVRVVHAGVVPGVPLEQTPAAALLRIRTIDGDGRWSDDRNGGSPWGGLYRGPPHLVFGHDAAQKLQPHPWATGIDTGCVYGGQLTALVLQEGEPMPRGAQALAKLVSAPARRAYAPTGGPGQ